MNIYSHPIDEVFESLKTMDFDQDLLLASGQLVNLHLASPWNKGMTGYTRQPHSEESKQKISAAKKGKSIKGTPASEESKEKNRKAHLGKKRSAEAVEKGRLKNIGQKRSEETKQRISNTLKGRQSSLKGTNRSDDIKKKISESKRGKKRIYREDGSFYMQ